MRSRRGGPTATKPHRPARGNRQSARRPASVRFRRHDLRRVAPRPRRRSAPGIPAGHPAADGHKKSRREIRGGSEKPSSDQERLFETSLVISNMETFVLPPKTAFSLSSALIWVFTFASCSLFFLM